MRSLAALTAIGLGVALGAPAEAGPQCSCRYKGQDVPVGGQVCLKTPHGMRIATCGFELNNTSWKFSKRTCGQVAGRTAPTDQAAAFLKFREANLPASK